MNARHGLALALVIVLPRVAAAQHGEWGFRLGLDDALDAVAAVGVDPDNEPLPIPPRPALHATAFGLGGGQETSSAGSAPELPRLAGPMNRTSRWLTGGLAAASSVWLTTHDRFDSGDRDAVEGPGDLFQYALPAAGFTTAWAVGDTTGRNQQLLAMGVTMAAVGGLKELSEKWRPNFSAQSSFPSGHTAGAFTGAAFVHQRYGARWGAPAYVLAGYTGLSRVFAQKHFLDDVVSGMSIGILSNLLVTRPIDPERASRQRDPDRARRYRFTWEMGRGLQSKNRIAAPAATGTSFDPELTGEANPTTTGRVAISRRLGDRQTVTLSLAPFEVRDLGDFDAPVDFQDKEFENSVVTFFTHNETRVAWDYGLRPSPALLLELGAGVSYLDTSVGLGIDVDGELSDDEEELAEAPHDQLVPLARGAATVRLAERFEVSLSGSYGSLSSVEKLFDAVLRLRYRWPARWDLAVDYRRYERRLAAKSLYNDLVIEGPGVAVGYRF